MYIIENDKTKNITTEEYLKRFSLFCEELKKDPKRLRQFFIDAGITTVDGNLTDVYK